MARLGIKTNANIEIPINSNIAVPGKCRSFHKIPTDVTEIPRTPEIKTSLFIYPLLV